MTQPEPPTILVIDDDPGISDIFTRVLRLEGYRVETASNADTGLEIVAQRTPDGIILDLNVLRAGDAECLHRLCGNGSSRTTRVAIVTGDHLVDDETSAWLQTVGVEIWFKPLLFDDLISLARGLVILKLGDTDKNRGG